MKPKSDSKQFKALVRSRMEKTGEAYAVARAQIVKQRIETERAGHAIVGDGRLVPRRKLRVRPEADLTQLAKAIFGPKWEPPSERCVRCHTWISHDGYCACNGHQQSMETTEIITIEPVGAQADVRDTDPETLCVKKHLEEWMALPLLPENATEDSWHLAAKVGCLLVNAETAEATGLYSPDPDLFDLEELALGDVTIEIDGEWRRHRLPPELGSWASEQLQLAFEGRNPFPAFLSLRRGETRLAVRIRPLRV